MTDKYKIKKMYAFIAEDEGGEGVCAFQTTVGWMPMVASNMKRVKSLMPHAQIVADTTGKKITLCEFGCRTELETIDPDKDPTTGEVICAGDGNDGYS